MKRPFLFYFSLYSLILRVLFRFNVNISSFSNALSLRVIGCFIIHLFSYGIWRFWVTKKLFDFVAKKYAREIVSAIDKL